MRDRTRSPLTRESHLKLHMKTPNNAHADFLDKHNKSTRKVKKCWENHDKDLKKSLGWASVVGHWPSTQQPGVQGSAQQKQEKEELKFTEPNKEHR